MDSEASKELKSSTEKLAMHLVRYFHPTLSPPQLKDKTRAIPTISITRNPIESLRPMQAALEALVMPHVPEWMGSQYARAWSGGEAKTCNPQVLPSPPLLLVKGVA